LLAWSGSLDEISTNKNGCGWQPVLPRGRVNLKQVDMTTEQDILRHATLDDEAYRHQGKSAIDAALAGSCADLGAGCFVK
jgi:hypothetical protein